MLSLHSVLDDLELFHLHCVDVVLGVHVHNLFNGSLRDPVLRYTVFDQSFRVRDLLHDFRDLLSTESVESPICLIFARLIVVWINLLSLNRLLDDFERLHLMCVHDLLDLQRCASPASIILAGLLLPLVACRCHDLF